MAQNFLSVPKMTTTPPPRRAIYNGNLYDVADNGDLIPVSNMGTFGASMSPSFGNSQAALSQSQGILDKVRASQSALTSPGAGNFGALLGAGGMESAKGFGKGLLKTLDSTSAFGAGPVGLGMTNAAPDVMQKREEYRATLEPSNEAQKIGQDAASLAEMAIPTGSGIGLLKTVKQLPVVSKFLAKRAEKKSIEALQSTAETMTKGERKTAIAEGRMEPTLTGGGTYKPSKTETRAGQILSGKLQTNPVRNVDVVQKEISMRGKEAEEYLEKNLQKITNEEDFNAFAQRAEEMEKYSTPNEMRAYRETIDTFQRVLKTRGEYNTANYYKALKEFEENVTRNIPKGKEALLVEGGSARLQAAKDVRSVVRTMIGEKHGEFKDKMFDLASLYDALDNVIAKAEKVEGSGWKEFAKRHPITTSAVGATGLTGIVNYVREKTGI